MFLCNLFCNETTTLIVEYKTLKQVSSIHFSQNDQGSARLSTWLFCFSGTGTLKATKTPNDNKAIPSFGVVVILTSPVMFVFASLA